MYMYIDCIYGMYIPCIYMYMYVYTVYMEYIHIIHKYVDFSKN